MNKKISVITGATSGIGEAVSYMLGQEFELFITSSSSARLNKALKGLEEKGIMATGMVCDISNYDQVYSLAERAAKLGKVANVVNSAGVAPAQCDAERVLKINALGTAYVIEAFYQVMEERSVLINISSTAPRTVAGISIPTELLRLDPLMPEFLEEVMKQCKQFPEKAAGGMAYIFSKWFVSDYTARNAKRFGGKGIRILSVSPGTIMTPFYYNGAKDTSDKMLDKTPLMRHGRPEEVGELIRFLASDKAGFITGTDIICDGGLVSGLSLQQI